MWKMVKLGDVCDLQNGFAFKSNLFKEDGLPILRISNIQQDVISLKKLVYFSEDDYSIDFERYKVFQNDLLIAMSGATTGKLGFNQSGKTFFLNQRVGKFLPHEKLNKKYLYYILSTKVEENLNISKGAAQPNLSTKQIKDIEFFLPPLPEQERIVAKLDAAFAEIDKCIKISKAQAGSINSLKSQFISNALKMNSQTIPLGDCCSFLNGYAFKSKEVVEASETQLLRMGNLYENKLDLERKPVFYPDEYANQYSRYVLAKDDIVMTLTGTVGKKDYGYALKIEKQEKTLLLNQRILKLYDFKKTIINQEYLLYFLRSESFLSELYSTSNGTRQANLSSDMIKKLEIPVPSLDEQEKVVSAFKLMDGYHNQFFECFALKALNLSKLKSAILSQELQSSEAA